MNDNDNDNALGFALGYVLRYGWMIFPVPPGSKKSYKSARYSGGRAWGMTDDSEEIERDFAQWPWAGVGVPTGAINRIFVLEADTVEGHGVDGLAGLRALELEYGDLPETLTARSPTGSIHRYFKQPKLPPRVKFGNLVGKLAPGVDICADGGMAVAPPTRTAKGRYRWANDLAIADAPPWLIKLATSRPPKRGAVIRDVESGKPHKPVTEAELQGVMAGVPNDDQTTWEQWCRIGMALFAATNGSDYGLALFDAWSQKHEGKYDPDGTTEKWEKFKTSPPKVIGVGTLFYEARRAQDEAEMEAWEQFQRELRRADQ